MTDWADPLDTTGVLAAGPASVTPAEADRSLTLADGRRLVYNVYGAPDGQPVLYLHGFPGSRLEAGLTNAVAYRLGLRLVAPDRPGIGRSDPQPGRRLWDWAGDARQLADALGWGRFPVLGVSDHPEGNRGMRWFGRMELLLARYRPGLARPLLRWAVAATLSHPQGLPRWASGGLPAVDREVLMRPEIAQLYRESVRESVRQGLDAAMQELRLLAHPWGFPMSEIGTFVRLWHGGADITVPESMGRYVASCLPRCQATYYPDEGHFSLPIKHAGVILGDLKEGSAS